MNKNQPIRIHQMIAHVSPSQSSLQSCPSESSEYRHQDQWREARALAGDEGEGRETASLYVCVQWHVCTHEHTGSRGGEAGMQAAGAGGLTVVQRKRSADRPNRRETEDPTGRSPWLCRCSGDGCGPPQNHPSQDRRSQSGSSAYLQPRAPKWWPHREPHTPTHQAKVPARSSSGPATQGLAPHLPFCSPGSLVP